MSTQSSDSTPEQSQKSPVENLLWLTQGKVRLQQWYQGLKRRFPLKHQANSLINGQPDPLQEIGSYLRQTRKKQGLSLEAIADRTQIPVRLLQALEEGNREDLPEAVYIRGMIKRFGDLVGINGTELSHDLPLEEIERKKVSSLKISLPLLQLRPIHLYFLYILLVVLAVQGLSNSLRKAAMEGHGENPINLPKEASLVQKEPSPPAHATKPVVTPSPVAKNALTLEIQLKADCHLKVVVDGKTAFDGVLPKGTQRTWKAKERLTLRAEDAGKVTVVINQGKPQLMGKLGQIHEVTYHAAPKS